MSAGVWRAAVAIYVVVRLGMAFLPGYVNDVQSYKNWAVSVAAVGLPDAYARTPVDYPPLMLYVLWGVGAFWLEDASAEAVPDSPWFTFLVKAPNAVYDLALGALLLHAVRRFDLWRRGPDPAARREAARRTALAFWYNPAVLFGSAYWGQPDGAHSALAVGALILLAAGRFAGSGALLSLGGLAKPLAAPLVPLLAIGAGLRGRARGLLACGAGGLGAAILVFAPWWATGRIAGTLRKVLLDVEAMPFTSVNGHTLWWLLGPWRNANAAWLGPLSAKQIALALFLAAYGALVARWWRRRAAIARLDAEPFAALLFATSAAIVATFFFLSTHMHENHLFLAIPLLLALAGRDRATLRTAAACSVAAFLNMALHDPQLPYALPGFLSAPSTHPDPHLSRPYTWLQWTGSHANALLVGAVAAAAYRGAWRAAGPAGTGGAAAPGGRAR